MPWLVEKHKPRGWGGDCYYSDTGIDVSTGWLRYNLSDKGHCPEIVGMLWRSDADSPYTLKVRIAGKIRYFALEREDQR